MGQYIAACRLMYWNEQNPATDFFISNLIWWIKHQGRLLWNVWIEEPKRSQITGHKQCVNRRRRSAVFNARPCQSMNIKRRPDECPSSGRRWWRRAGQMPLLWHLGRAKLTPFTYTRRLPSKKKNKPQNSRGLLRIGGGVLPLASSSIL